jgi:hypothetical protein
MQWWSHLKLQQQLTTKPHTLIPDPQLLCLLLFFLFFLVHFATSLTTHPP